MMAIAPELVRLDQLAAGRRPDRTEGLVFRYTAPSLSRNGVTGRPSQATPELGPVAAGRGRAHHGRARRARTDRRAAPGRTARAGEDHMTGAPWSGSSSDERPKSATPRIGATWPRSRPPAVCRSCCRPARIVDRHALTAVVDHCHSIVVTGGGDVDPHHYGVANRRSPDELMDVDADSGHGRDRRRPVRRGAGEAGAGVCRGAQLLAVMGGGTLILDLKEKGLDGHWDEIRQYEPVHRHRGRERLFGAADSRLGRPGQLHPPSGHRRSRSDAARHGLEPRRRHRGRRGAGAPRGAVAPRTPDRFGPAPPGAVRWVVGSDHVEHPARRPAGPLHGPARPAPGSAPHQSR